MRCSDSIRSACQRENDNCRTAFPTKILMKSWTRVWYKSIHCDWLDVRYLRYWYLFFTMPTNKGRGRKANATVQIPNRPAAGSEGEEFNFEGISDTPSEGGQGLTRNFMGYYYSLYIADFLTCRPTSGSSQRWICQRRFCPTQSHHRDCTVRPRYRRY